MKPTSSLNDKETCRHLRISTAGWCENCGSPMRDALYIRQRQ